MPQLLTTKAIIRCPHDGLGTTTPLHPLLLIEGGIACTEGDMGRLDCPFVPLPCTGYRLQSMGLNATRIDGERAILTTDFNLTFTGLPLFMTEMHSTRDDSTGVLIPNGQPPPPLPPELADMVAPTVMILPPNIAFNATTLQPAVLTATFTLAHPFPLRWMLTLVSETPPGHWDVTQGVLPGLALVPAGGAWTTPTLTVQMSMTAAYVATLGSGLKHFYLTGISQRGLSTWAELVLMVS